MPVTPVVLSAIVLACLAFRETWRQGGPEQNNTETPLMKATRRGKADEVQALLASAADPGLRNCQGLTALELVRQTFGGAVPPVLDELLNAEELPCHSPHHQEINPELAEPIDAAQVADSQVFPPDQEFDWTPPEPIEPPL